MKKSVKLFKKQSADPPVLDMKPELPKPATQMPERYRHAGRKGQRGGR